ncbi:glycoside hydrolase family 2 protein [Paenibacillus sp. GCM10027626]|uniref:glycoside hydrolase family 2 protein n=1 Tax=Paenibacillus sp. GCM10027626 TaxID=3273411 RepID=UPI00362F0BC7
MKQASIPRPEYPRPQFVREHWLNLNGPWQFEIDHGCSGIQRGLYKDDVQLAQTITVPFAPESSLSGIGYTDFMNAVWYRRTFEIPGDWDGDRVLLHFGAVDYKAEVWVNEQRVGTHRGGYTSFSFDITAQLKAGANTVSVYAEDHLRTGLQPAGKQSSLYHSHACLYTRTTGIWQTVWLERVPQTYIASIKLYPDPDNAALHLEANIAGSTAGLQLKCESSYKGAATGSSTVQLGAMVAKTTIALSDVHLWQPGAPELYDLQLQLVRKADGAIVDAAVSYFGLRSIQLDGMAFRINGKSVFQRLVLDQGFYPDGIYTAPTDEALKQDIEISLGLGFNGARLHEKIFEPRFLYWADQLGYLVWGEHANWGLNVSKSEALEQFLPEWIEGVERDFNHPSLIGWCPFNETWDDERTGARQNNEVLRTVYEATKAIDPTRPVIDTSGNYHVVTDIFDVHDYDQNPETFKARYESLRTGEGEINVSFPARQQYEGQPYFVSEYGGIWWNPGQSDEKGWGYGGTDSRPKSEAEFIARYEGLTNALLEHPKMFGFCYTQLYDVEQEVNGLYTYDRKPKFDPAILHAINSKKAAIED